MSEEMEKSLAYKLRSLQIKFQKHVIYFKTSTEPDFKFWKYPQKYDLLRTIKSKIVLFIKSNLSLIYKKNL